MKICWNNLESLIYDKKIGMWIKYVYYNNKRGNYKYVYVDSCEWCHDPFLSMKDNVGKFCCRSCGISHKQTGKQSPLKGKKLSLGHIEKIRKGNTGKVRTAEMKERYSLSKKGVNSPWYNVKGEQHPNYGKKLSAACLEAMYVGMRKLLKDKGLPFNKSGHPLKGVKRPDKSGPNSHFWKGGIASNNDVIRKSLEYCEWRSSVLKRDNYTCQKCNKIGGKLIAHHIIPFNIIITNNMKILFDLNNGLTLCEKCHKRHHSVNGYKYVSNNKLDTDK